jgi:hypothetical protein
MSVAKLVGVVLYALFMIALAAVAPLPVVALFAIAGVVGFVTG